jgi:carbamoylphosphate synthase large subunit
MVTGAGGPAGQAAIAALVTHGYHVIATDCRRVEHGAHEFFLVPRASERNFVVAVRDLILRQEVDWLLPTAQEELVPIARNASYLRELGVNVYVAEPRATTICHDKWHTTMRLASAGVPVPRSTLTAPTNSWPSRLGNVVLSKPRVGRGGRGVVIHERPGIPPSCREVIWQEYLGGTEYDVVMLLHPDGPHQVLCMQVLEKVELREGRTGNALQVRAVEAEDVAVVALDAARALSLSGPLDIDVRRDQRGLPHVLEINARVGAHSLEVPDLFRWMVALDRGAYK